MRRKKLTQFDRLLLFAFAVGILLVYVRYRTLSDSPLTNDGDVAKITCTLQIGSLSGAKALSEAESVLFADSHTPFGRMEETKTISSAYLEAVRPDGTTAYLPSEHARELRFTILAKGSFTENGFFAEGQRHITANQRIPVLINGLNVTILVLNVSHFSSK